MSDAPWEVAPEPGPVGRPDGAVETARILLTGDLNSDLAGQVAIQLMAHDAHSDWGVELFIRSDQGTVAAALTLMDTIDAMGVPVTGIALGQVSGPALGVLALCHLRKAGPSSRLRFCHPVGAAQGTAEALQAQLRIGESDLERFVALVARATRQPAERVEIDLREQRQLSPEEAIAYHLIDEIWAKR
jgi:ATP-dependent Clp protease protease subunit